MYSKVRLHSSGQQGHLSTYRYSRREPVTCPWLPQTKPARSLSRRVATDGLSRPLLWTVGLAALRSKPDILSWPAGQQMLSSLKSLKRSGFMSMGNFFTPGQLNSARPDVAEHFGNSAFQQSGFHYSVPLAQFRGKSSPDPACFCRVTRGTYLRTPVSTQAPKRWVPSSDYSAARPELALFTTVNPEDIKLSQQHHRSGTARCAFSRRAKTDSVSIQAAPSYNAFSLQARGRASSDAVSGPLAASSRATGA